MSSELGSSGRNITQANEPTERRKCIGATDLFTIRLRTALSLFLDNDISRGKNTPTKTLTTLSLFTIPRAQPAINHTQKTKDVLPNQPPHTTQNSSEQDGADESSTTRVVTDTVKDKTWHTDTSSITHTKDEVTIIVPQYPNSPAELSTHKIDTMSNEHPSSNETQEPAPMQGTNLPDTETSKANDKHETDQKTHDTTNTNRQLRAIIRYFRPVTDRSYNFACGNKSRQI